MSLPGGIDRTPGRTHPVFHLGLTGYPLGHSLSPALHAAALAAHGLAGAYRLYPVAPGPEVQAGLRALLERLRSGELHGLNVTIPHKQAVIPLLDEMTPTARAIGAVNTIFSRDGKLIGDNTDAPGFLADLGRVLGLAASHPASALVLGAGGSARAVVFAQVQAGWRVSLAARRVEQAADLAADLAALDLPAPQVVPLTAGALVQVADLGLLVNATPAGMTPDLEGSAWPAELPLPPRAIVYDLVYNPAETRLLRRARQAGLTAANGLGMLVEQAALAFERWTGVEAPRPDMLAAVEQVKGQQ